MDVDKDFQGVAAEISTAEQRNTDDEDSAMSVAFEAGEPQDEPSGSITSVEVDESDEFEDSETDLVRVNYREGGLYVIYSPEDAQRPRAVYHIQPNFEVIN
jgi:hypothetical protein